MLGNGDDNDPLRAADGWIEVELDRTSDDRLIAQQPGQRDTDSNCLRVTDSVCGYNRAVIDTSNPDWRGWSAPGQVDGQMENFLGTGMDAQECLAKDPPFMLGSPFAETTRTGRYVIGLDRARDSNGRCRPASPIAEGESHGEPPWTGATRLLDSRGTEPTWGTPAIS